MCTQKQLYNTNTQKCRTANMVDFIVTRNRQYTLYCTYYFFSSVSLSKTYSFNDALYLLSILFLRKLSTGLKACTNINIQFFFTKRNIFDNINLFNLKNEVRMYWLWSYDKIIMIHFFFKPTALFSQSHDVLVIISIVTII